MLPSWQQPGRGRAVDVRAPYLEGRLTEECRNAALLWRELKALGFRGRYTAVKRWIVEQRRAETQASVRQEDGTIWSPPSTRRIARLLMIDAAGMDTPDATLVAGLLSKAPTLADTVSAARRLALLLRHKSRESLSSVLDTAGRTLRQAFVATLRKDIAAVPRARQSMAAAALRQAFIQPDRASASQTLCHVADRFWLARTREPRLTRTACSTG